MADISQIQVGSTTYDVKDSTARSGLSTKLGNTGDQTLYPSSGDTDVQLMVSGPTSSSYYGKVKLIGEDDSGRMQVGHNGDASSFVLVESYHDTDYGDFSDVSVYGSDENNNSIYAYIGTIDGAPENEGACVMIEEANDAVNFFADKMMLNNSDTVAYADIADTVENAVHKGTVNLSAPGTIRTGSTAPASVTTTGWSVGDLYIYVQS